METRWSARQYAGCLMVLVGGMATASQVVQMNPNQLLTCGGVLLALIGLVVWGGDGEEND